MTSAVPKDVLLQIFSGLASGLSDRQLDPFVANMHTALWALAATSLVGAGVSLEELRELVAAESARASLRREWRSGVDDPVRRREILDEALGHIDRQLELVRRRRRDIDQLEGERADKRAAVRRRLREV